MRIVTRVEDAINKKTLPPRSVIYCAGNAATPQVLLGQLGRDLSIQHVALYMVLPLGDQIDHLYSEERCQTLTHRVIFNSYLTREPLTRGQVHPMHLSETRNTPSVRWSRSRAVVGAGPETRQLFAGHHGRGRAGRNQVGQRQGGCHRRAQFRMPFVLGTTSP